MRHLILHTLAALTLATATTSPLLAEETVSQCLSRVTLECDAALAESNFIEKVAVGFVCTGMYATCARNTVTIHLSLM